jgi:hypothetical protein
VLLLQIEMLRKYAKTRIATSQWFGEASMFIEGADKNGKQTGLPERLR